MATLASEHKTVVGHGQFNIRLKKTRVSKDKVEDMHAVLYLLRSNMNNGRLFGHFSDLPLPVTVIQNVWPLRSTPKCQKYL